MSKDLIVRARSVTVQVDGEPVSLTQGDPVPSGAENTDALLKQRALQPADTPLPGTVMEGDVQPAAVALESTSSAELGELREQLAEAQAASSGDVDVDELREQLTSVQAQLEEAATAHEAQLAELAAQVEAAETTRDEAIAQVEKFQADATAEAEKAKPAGKTRAK